MLRHGHDKVSHDGFYCFYGVSCSLIASSPSFSSEKSHGRPQHRLSTVVMELGTVERTP